MKRSQSEAVQPVPAVPQYPPADDGGPESQLARQLLKLPVDLLGRTMVEAMQRHLDRGDWLCGELRELHALADRLADHLARVR